MATTTFVPKVTKIGAAWLNDVDAFVYQRVTPEGFKVLTDNDEGSGNGIDADTVDGLEASQFLRSDANDTTTGNLTVNKASPKIILDASSASASYQGYISGVLRTEVTTLSTGTLDLISYLSDGTTISSRLAITAGGVVNVVAGLFQLAGTTVSATAPEINYNAGVTAGTGLASKSVVLDASNNWTAPSSGQWIFPSGSTFDIQGTFQIGNTTVTATAVELNRANLTAATGTATAEEFLTTDASNNFTTAGSGQWLFSSGSTVDIQGAFKIGGVTVAATAAEINYNSSVSPGFGQANKAVVLNAGNSWTSANSGLWKFSSGSIVDFSGQWRIGNSTVLSSAAKLNFNNQAVAGTVVAGSTVVVDNSKDIGTFNTVTANTFVSTSNTPASASDTGVAGTITWDTNYIYVCTATNTWKRVGISTW